MNRVNLIEIYGSKDWEQVKNFMTTMIDQVNQQLPSNLRPNFKPQPLQVDLNQQTSSWKFITKYYEAILDMRYFVDLNVKSTDDDDSSTGALAVVILWESDDKHLLASLLPCFSNRSYDSRLVVVQIDAQLLEDDVEWHKICFEHGFECHSAFDLGEACMSWQCCAWPSIQIHGQTTSSLNLNKKISKLESTLNVSSSPSCMGGDQDQGVKDEEEECSKGVFGRLMGEGGREVEEEYGFEDDFSAFETAETSLIDVGWDYQKLSEEEEENSSMDVEQMAEELFGAVDCSKDGMDQLESLVPRLDELRMQAAVVDDESRRKIAARVALAVESRLKMM